MQNHTIEQAKARLSLQCSVNWFVSRAAVMAGSPHEGSLIAGYGNMLDPVQLQNNSTSQRTKF